MRLATYQHEGITHDLAFKPEELVRHLTVLGKTGTGKSNFQELQALDAIRADAGRAPPSCVPRL